MKNNINGFFRSASLLAFFFIFGISAYGQNCDPNVFFSTNNFNVNLCGAETFTLNPTITGVPAGLNNQYTWTFDPPGNNNTVTINNANSSSLTLNPITSNSVGVYTVEVDFENGNGCGQNQLASITVNLLSPSINAGNNLTLCQGQSANINSTISGLTSIQQNNVTYVWTSNLGNFTSTLADPNFSNLPVGEYTFTAVASYGTCTFSDNVTVTVNPTPAAPFFSIANSGCPGVSLPITSFTPSPNITYSWHPNGGNFSNGSTSNPSVIFSNGGSYNVYVTATNSNGCSSNSPTQNVAVTDVQVLNPYVEFAGAPLNPNIYNNTTTYTICGGSSGGSSASIYNTFPNGSNANYTYTSLTQNQDPLVNGTPEEMVLSIGNNYFTITGSLNGCVVSQTFNVYAGSNPYVAGGVSNSVGLCTGQTVNFSISTINPSTNSPNASGTTYTIGVSDIPSSIPTVTNSAPYATFTDINGNQNVPYTFNTSSCGQSSAVFPANTFYAVIQASNACGTTTSSVSPIVVSSAPTANFNVSPTTICTNSTVTITNTGISGSAVSSPNNQAPFTCTNTGKFFYTISPSTGWTVSTGSIGAAGVPASNWNGVTSASNNVVITFSSAGTYTITQKYQNGCGTSTLQKTICVVAPPVCAFTVNPTNSCTPLVTTVNNSTTGPSCGTTPLALTYTWSVTNPVGGTSSINTTTSSVNPTIALNNNTVAPNLALLNFPINVVVNPLIPGTSNPVPNCSSTCNQTVTVCPQPSFITQPVQPATVCLDGTFNALSVSVSYLCPGLPTYQWYSNINPTSSGGILITGATSSSYIPPANAVGTIYYYCVVTFPNNTNCNQIISNNVPAIVVADPIASASPTTQTICVGGTVPVSFTGSYTPGTGTASYQWNTVSGATSTAISGATASAYTPPVFTTTGTFNYSVTINTSGSGCTANTSAPISVIVIPDPTITTQPVGNTYCQNTPMANITALTVNATGGSGTFSYQWFVNSTNANTGGTAIPGATSASYLPPSTVVGTFYYYCEISQTVTNCNVSTNTAQIIIVTSPTFTTQPLITQTICNGGTTTSLVIATTGGSGNISYQWYSNTTNNNSGGVLIPGATTSSYTPTNTNGTLPNTTYYYCVVSYSSGGCSNIYSSTATVTILPDPVISLQPTSTQTICVGGSSAPLTVALQAATGIGAFTYQWYSNTTATNSGGTIISGATAATYTPAAFTTNGTFYYYCIVTDAGNGCGIVTSQVATVVVVVDPTITAQPLLTQTLCQNAAPTALTITASGGTGALLYQWFSNSVDNTTGGTLISGATASTYTPSTAAVGTLYYYCVVTTAASGCSVTSATGAVVVNPAPTFTTQPASSNVCVGGTPTQMCVTYSNGTGTPSYQWYSAATNSTTGGTLITGATSSCFTPPSTNTGTTYYYATISLTGGGCSSITSSSGQVVITPDPVIIAQPTSTQTFCVGGSSTPLTVALQATTGIGPFTYQWYSNTTASNTGGTPIVSANAATYNPPIFNTSGTFYYYCLVTDAGNGCGTVTSQVATIIVVVDPTITAQPIATQTLCQTASPSILSVTASGGAGALQYQWYSNTANNTTLGTLISGAVNSTYSPPTSIVGTVYYYCVVTTSASGCSVTSANSAVIVNAAPIFVTQPTPSSVCVGGTTNQMCVTYSNGTGTPSYQWYSSATNSASGGTAITGATNSCYTPSAALAGTTYYYAVISLAGGGCTSITSNTGEVIINANTSLSAQPTPTQTICVGGSIPTPLSVSYSGGVGTPAYQWFESPSNLAIVGATSSNYTPPIFSIPGTTSYYVSVTLAGAGCGIQTSSVANIIVVADPTVTASSGSSYCQNAGNVTPLSVTASGGQGTTSYQWFSNTIGGNTTGVPIAGANTFSYTPPVNATGTTNYYCVLTQSGANCSVTSSAAQITVTPAPNFTTQPTSTQSVCVGGTTTPLTVAYSNGTGAATYQWYANTSNSYSGGTALPGQTSNSFTPPSVISSAIYYYCIVSFAASGGCSMINSNIAEVNVLPDPTISVQPLTTQTICVGGTIPLALSVNYTGGVGTPTYQWFSAPSNSISGATNNSYTPATFVNPGTFNYYATLNLSGSGCDALTSTNATIIVVADPTATISSNASYCQNAGNVTALTVVVSNGQGTPSYQWYSNTMNSNTGGTLIANANAISYSPPVANTGTTYYYCLINQSGTNCAVNSPAAQIIVTPAPTFTSQPTATQSVCLGGVTTLLSVAYSNGTGTASYQWYANTANTYAGGNAITGQTSATFSPPSGTSGTTYYYCIISFAASGGCSMINSNIAVVNVLPDPSISAQPLSTQTLCVGGTIAAALNVSYTGGVGTPTYQWFSAPATPIIGETNSSFTPSVFNTSGAFNYYVTINLSGSGCDALTSANAIVNVVADPTTTISPGASYCQNAGSVSALTVVVSGGQGTPSYQWYSSTTNTNTGGSLISGANGVSYSPPVASTGTTYYYCVVAQSGANCGVNSPTSQIIVTPAPTFTTQPTPTQSVCVGGATNPLNVAYNNGTGTASFQWYSNNSNSLAGGVAIAGQTSPAYSPPSAVSGTKYYYCIISFSAAGGCSMINSNIAEVIVLPDPTISAQPLTSQTICVGGTIPLALSISYTGGVGTPNYQWFSAPATSISGANSNSFTPSTFVNPGTFNYYATVNLSGAGCDVLTSSNATIIVIADPVVSIQPLSIQSVCQNTATSPLSVSITGGNGIATYQWFSNTTNSNSGGTLISGETLSTFIPPSVVVGTQYYYCVINQSGTNCSVTSSPASVVVNLAPVFSTQPVGTQQLCLNAATTALQVVYSNGTGTPSYQWYLNTANSTLGGTAINAATNNSFTPPSNMDGTFYYYCVVSFNNGGGCPSITSNVSQVIIHPYPIVNITGGQTICLLESSNLNFAFTPTSGLYDITISANGISTVIENFNGVNSIYTVTPSLTTTYSITNIAYDQVPQCAIHPNNSIVVIVNPLPALNNSNYTFCSDVATTSLQYIPDANTYTYNWLPNTSANYPGQNNGPSVINVTLPNPLGNAPTNFYYVSDLTNNSTGCHALDSILVTINPNPVGSFTLPTTGCINSPIALSNGDATIGSYVWSIDGTLYSVLANPTPPVFNTLGDHTIEMVAINSYGCTDTLNSVIQIYDLPVSNFTTDITNGCAPLPVNFTNLSSGQYVTSYDWTFAPDTVSWVNHFTSTSLINPPSVTFLQGDVTTIYTVTLAVTNACGTVTSQQDITALPTPEAEFTLATHTICSGSVLMVNNVSVGEPTSYTWNYGNFTSYNPNLTSMFFPSDSLTHVYPILLTLSNACGTDAYNDSITVLPDNVHGGFTTSFDAGCSPLTVTLTNTSFNTNLSASWHLDDPLNTVIDNQNSIQFTYLAVNNISQNYNPYLVVTDGCANDTVYTNISVFANPIPNISASQTNICAGSTIDFSGSVNGGGTGFGYTWDFGGLGISNTQSSAFTFPNGTALGLSVPVTLVVSSPNNTGSNCSNSITTTIHVYSNPDLGQITFNTISGCSELDVSISNLPSATNQINWGDGITNFNNSHTYTNNGSGLQSNSVVINSAIAYGTAPVLTCTTTSTQLVNVFPTPLPQIFSSAINVCEEGSIDFIATTANNQNNGVTYQWDFGVLGTNNNANTSLIFTNGNASGLQTPIQLTAFQNTSGTICTAAVTQDVYVFDTPDLSTALYSDVNNCSPLLVSITNLPTSTYTYDWGDGIVTSNPNHLYLNQGTSPLNYNISINATSYYQTLPQLSCSSSANQIVQVNPQPFAAFNLSPSESCLYVPVNTTLQNTSLNAIAPYVWNFDGIAHTTNSLNYIGTFSTPGAHPIELIVSNQFGCTDSVSHDFIIHELPTVTLNTVADDLCIGATAEFVIDGTGISTSTWDFGDGTILNLLNPTTLAHYYSQPGVYSLEAIVTNVFGCTDTVTFQNEVIVHPSPTASFTTNVITADIVYPYFEFYDFSVGAINYYWNFGDSNWSNEISPIHSYNSEGDYLVELTVSNEYNCYDVATQVVHVEGIVVYVPNAFTPLDYNGVNDVFKPSFSSTDGIEFYEFSIFDRWGKKIFKTNDLDEPWIGNGKEHNAGDDNYYAQNDVYTWQVIYRKKARANDPQPDRVVTGHVTIIR